MTKIENIFIWEAFLMGRIFKLYIYIVIEGTGILYLIKYDLYEE